MIIRFRRHSSGVFPNRRMRMANYNHFPCLTEEKVKKGKLNLLRLTVRQMHVYLYLDICNVNVILSKLVRLKSQFKTEV